jgi:hypothetical protein
MKRRIMKKKDNEEIKGKIKGKDNQKKANQVKKDREED